VLSYEKDIGDILELSDDTVFLEVLKEEEFAPVIYKTGKYSEIEAVKAMSKLHQHWLGIGGIF